MAGSIRKEGTSWYYVLEIYENGKRKQRKRRGFRTKREAQSALIEAQNALMTGKYVKPSSKLLKDYLKEWMNIKQHSIARETAKTNLSYINNHIIPEIGSIQMSKLTALDVQKLISRLLEKGLATSTVKRIFNILNTALNKAEKMQIVQRNVATLVDKPKVKRKELKIWSINEVYRFLEAAKSSRYYTAFHLAIMTGMRQGEILGLRWQDVDFDNCKIYIRQTLSHDGKEFNTGAKTSSGIRSITIDHVTMEKLKRQYRIITVEKKHARSIYNDKDLVICTSTGNQVSPSSIVKIFRKLLLNSNLNRITFHDLRHTHASLLLMQNVHPKIVSERLGHSSIQMTLDTYSHLMPNMQEEAANGLANMLFTTTV